MPTDADVDQLLARAGALIGASMAVGSLLSGALVWWHPSGRAGQEVAKSWPRSSKALNSIALPLGSRKNIVHCSPGVPSKRT